MKNIFIFFKVLLTVVGRIIMEQRLQCQIRKVTFDLHPTIYMYLQPPLTEEEQRKEQEERWELFLQSLKIGP